MIPARRLVLVLAGTIPFLFFELLLRTPLAPAPWRRLSVSHGMYAEHTVADPELGLRLRTPYHRSIVEPGLRLEFTHQLAPVLAAKSASWGYRADGTGAKTGAAEPKGWAAEIVVLGDSFTYGWLVSDGETWVSRLGALTGRRAVNLGVSGYGTSQEAALYRLYGRAFRPRLVLIQLCSNDIADNLLYRDWRSRENATGLDFGAYMNRRIPLSSVLTSRVARFLFRHSLLAVQFTRWLPQVNRYPQSSEEAASGMRMLREDLAGLHEELSSQGRAFAVVIVDGEWPQKSRADLRAFLAGRRLPFLDLADSGVWRSRGRKLQFWGDAHWNARGHALAAAETYRFLRREGLLIRCKDRVHAQGVHH